MTPQQKAELEFWRGEFARYGQTEYVRLRQERDLQHYAELLPEIMRESGPGLDLACGLVSILGGLACRPIYAVDALLNEYDAIYQDTHSLVQYSHGDGERLRFGRDCFDFVWCMNAIDHTPNPERMIAEIQRVLAPGGHLYFFVNFDPKLYAPHYRLWNIRTVEEHLAPFKLYRKEMQ